MKAARNVVERFSPAMESAIVATRARVVAGLNPGQAAAIVAKQTGFSAPEIEKAYSLRFPKPFKQPEKVDRHRPQAYPRRVAAWVTEEQRAVFNKIGSKGLRMLLDGTTLVTVLRQIKPRGRPPV